MRERRNPSVARLPVLALLCLGSGGAGPAFAAAPLSPAALGLTPVPLVEGDATASSALRLDGPSTAEIGRLPLGAPRVAGVSPVTARITPPRPAALFPLYAGFVGLQTADVVTTFRALDAGAVEGNPLMGGLVGNRAAFVAVKAGMTAGTLWLSERLWRRNRVASVVMLAAFNIAYAAVVAHNARVISSLQQRQR